ncbi:methylated-DNA--[protein]-cysteine S-methyltransferase [Limibacter armeniacum]|uniref:methylated-DNA--[protein]-cysteine S-methyltransferase n=1 Tax=Limibacter armeniacum TaxID=466084 RepID=UPI002FE680B5
MQTINIQHFNTSFGELILGDFQGEICICDWRYRKMRDTVDNRIKTALKAEFTESDTPLLSALRDQLSEYFQGTRNTFDLPLLLIGTDFQKTVWNELINVPYGKTETYLGLSRKLQNEKAIRAVASANGANSIAIIIPCHRIIGSNGELTGYAGGLNTKKKLLQLEGVKFPSEQLSLF